MSEIYVRGSDKRLIVNGRTYAGRTLGSGGLARELYISAATRELRWVDDLGVLRAAKGVDVGSTGQANGSLWLNSQGDPCFALGGRAYNIWRNLFRNNVAGATLLVYSNSARTSLVASVGPGSTATYAGHFLTYYLRLRGISRTQDTHDLVVTANAGHTYTVAGSYTPSSVADYECEVTFDKVSYGNTCSETDCTSKYYGDNSCSRSSMRTCVAVDPHEYGASYMRTDYKCKSIKIGSDSPAAWSVTVAES